MKNYKILLQFFVVFFFSFTSFSQSLVSGVVVDGTTNEPLIGANVSIKGTTDGTFTGLDGSFSFSTNASTSDVVLISYIGYEDVEIANSGDLGNIQMTQLTLHLMKLGLLLMSVLTERLLQLIPMFQNSM